MSGEVMLGLLHGLLWCAFLSYLAFGVLGPLLRRVREIESILVALTRVLVDEGIGKGRIKIKEKP